MTSRLRDGAGDLVRMRWVVAALGACAYFLVSQARAAISGDTDDHLLVNGVTVAALTATTVVGLWPAAAGGRNLRRGLPVAVGAVCFVGLATGLASTDSAFAFVPATWLLAACVSAERAPES